MQALIVVGELWRSYTNLSDTCPVDPNDIQRLADDLESYKAYFSQIKFGWMESAVKRSYLQRLLGQLEDEPGLVTQADVDQAEDVRAQRKAEVKAKKAEAEQIRQAMVQLVKDVDRELSQNLTPVIEEARLLTREIQDMEIELGHLRNSRPEADRMTVEEANNILEEQV